MAFALKLVRKSCYIPPFKAVIAESNEHMQRSNLIGMGTLPGIMPGESVTSLGLRGREHFDT